MKKSLLKDSIRQIKNTFKRFLSLVLIVLLGVGFFAGLKASSPDMKEGVDKYFDQQNMMDIEVISTLGLTDNDITALSQVEGVKQVVPTYSFDAIVKTEKKDYVVKIESMPEGINELELLEGNLPTAQDECVVEKSFLTGTGYKIGDYITVEPEKMDSSILNSNNENTIENNEENSEDSVVKTKKIKIVGAVNSPTYISRSRGNSKLGSGSINFYMYIPKSNINMNAYTIAYITANGALELKTYKDNYEDLITNVTDNIDAISEERKQARYDEIVNTATGKLNDAQAEYDEQKQKAENEIADAEKQLQDARQEIENGENELAANKKKAQTEFANADKQIAEAEAQIESAKTEFESKKQEANAQISQAETQIENLKAQKEQLSQAPQTPEIVEQIAQIDAAISSIQTQINTAKQELTNAETQITASEEELNSKKTELANTKKTTNRKLAEAQEKIDEAKTEIAENEAKLTDAKKEAEEKLAEAQEKINDARAQINKIEKPTWYILDRNSNSGYVEYIQDTDRIGNLAKVFPLVFFLVAALISLTSMSRMIEEQRVQIGTLKALGYNKAQISTKYIIYALLATVIGGAAGMVIGTNLIPRIVYSMYAMMYTLPGIEYPLHLNIGLMGLAFALVCTVGATIYTCIKELKEKPANLMLPRAPKPGKRIFLEKIKFFWNRLKFTQKVTARNIFRYKKKFLMTIIGVAGCTALIVAGFGIRDAISRMIPSQYGEIFKYNATITLNDDITTNQITEEDNKIKSEQKIEVTLTCYMKTVEITNIENSQTLNLIVTDSPKNLPNFIALKSRTKNEEYKLENDKVIISEKIANLLNIKVGDTITIKNVDDIEKNVTIGAITENYLNHYIYMTSDLYNKLYGENTYKPNTILLKEVEDTTIEDEENLGRTILSDDSIVTGVTFLSNTKDIFADVMDNMQLVVYILIIAAGLLAFAVLYNLSNVNISERIKELATIKVLGFYNNEVFNYVTKETRILTGIGILLGLFGGYFLTMYVMKTCELDVLMFDTRIRTASYIYGIVITVVFAEIVNIAVNHTLKKISMTESLKSVD